MRVSIFTLSCLLGSLHTTVATTHRLSSHQDLPKRPISFLPPSQNPILTYLPTPGEFLPIRGIVKVSSYGFHKPIPVAFSYASQFCMPLIHEVPYIIPDLSQRILSEHLNEISFPFSSYPQTPPLPIYLVANITELIYRSKFVLSLSLKLSPLESGVKGVGIPGWRAIIGVLENSAQEVHKGARKRDGTGMGSVLALEAAIERVHVLAEWKFWKIVDGRALICES